MPSIFSRAPRNVHWSEPDSSLRTPAPALPPTSTASQPTLNFTSEHNVAHHSQLFHAITPSYNSVDPFHGIHSASHTTSGQTIDDVPVFSLYSVAPGPMSSSYHQPSLYHGPSASPMPHHTGLGTVHRLGSPGHLSGITPTPYGQYHQPMPIAQAGISNPPSRMAPYLDPIEPIVELPPQYQNPPAESPTPITRPNPATAAPPDPQVIHPNVDQHRYEPVPPPDEPNRNPYNERPPSPPQMAPIQYVHDTESLHSSKAGEDIPMFTRKEYIFAFIFDTLPRRCYLYLHLGLPALYFSRVTRIFKEADMSMPEIKKMALELPIQEKWKDRGYIMPVNFEPPTVPAPYENLKYTWESFIDSLMREWKTFNIISVLLLSAILTILQIQSAAADTLTRYSALMSLICALFSLLYGCMYIIRFGGMRKTHKAAEWAFEAQKTGTAIFWNVWVLLAMPLIWLAWSIILYMVCIMSFIWRTGSEEDDAKVPAKAHQLLIPRLVITCVFALALIYFVFIFSTFRRYGDVMDEAWSTRVRAWLREKAMSQSIHQSSRGPSTAQSRQPPAGDNPIRPQSFGHMPYSPNNLQNQRPNAPQASADAVVEPIPPPVRITPPPTAETNQSGPSRVDTSATVVDSSDSSPILSGDADAAVKAAMAYVTGRRWSSDTSSLGSTFEIEPDRSGQSHGNHAATVVVPLRDEEAEATLARITFQADAAYPQKPQTFTTTKVLDMRLEDLLDKDMKEVLSKRGLSPKHWADFLIDASKAWGSRKETYPDETSQNTPLSIGNTIQLMQKVVQKWNVSFVRHGIQLVVCREFFLGFPTSPVSAVYMVSLPQGEYIPIKYRFGPTHSDLDKIHVWHPLERGNITLATPGIGSAYNNMVLIFLGHPYNEFRTYMLTSKRGEGMACMLTNLVPTSLRKLKS